jgi:hypothetical protein
MKIINILGCIFSSITAFICCCTAIYGFYGGYWLLGINSFIWAILFYRYAYEFKCLYEIDKIKG